MSEDGFTLVKRKKGIQPKIESKQQKKENIQSHIHDVQNQEKLIIQRFLKGNSKGTK